MPSSSPPHSEGVARVNLPPNAVRSIRPTLLGRGGSAVGGGGEVFLIPPRPPPHSEPRARRTLCGGRAARESFHEVPAPAPPSGLRVILSRLPRPVPRLCGGRGEEGESKNPEKRSPICPPTTPKNFSKNHEKMLSYITQKSQALCYNKIGKCAVREREAAFTPCHFVRRVAAHAVPSRVSGALMSFRPSRVSGAWRNLYHSPNEGQKRGEPRRKKLSLPARAVPPKGGNGARGKG